MDFAGEPTEEEGGDDDEGEEDGEAFEAGEPEGEDAGGVEEEAEGDRYIFAGFVFEALAVVSVGRR